MKKIFTLVAMALMAVGANAQAVIAEIDWTERTEYLDLWYSDGATVSVEQGTGLIIESNPAEGANYWEPQVPMIGHIPVIEEGGQYQVKFTFTSPVAGELRLDFCSWDGSAATLPKVFEVAEGDNEMTIDFEDYPTPCTDAMIFYQCGKLPGKHIIKKVQVIDLDGEGGEEQPAEEETVDITPNFTNTWNEAETLETNDDGSITYNAVKWGGMAAWVAVDDVPVDWSGYSKVVFEFAEPTEVNTQIIVGDAKAWGEVGITSLECPFDGIDMSAISQIALQTSDATTIVVKRVYLVKAGATGIQSIQAAKAQDGAIYNLAGQKVNASYKGVVIKNGKKYFQK